MKKYSLLKAIGISAIVFMLLSWIIPVSYFDGTKIVSNGYDPMGLFDLLLMPIQFFNWDNVVKILKIDNVSIEFVGYIGNVLALLSIGIFYKILNKTGAYGNLIEKITKKLKDDKILFIVISIIAFTLISSLTGLSLLLFMLVPFFVTILLKLKYSRVTALASTVLPILVGRACSITAWDVTGINNAVYGVAWNTHLALRIISLIMFMVVLSAYVILSKSPADESKEDPLYDENVKKGKSYIPIIVLTSVFFIIIGVCMYNWYYVFNNTTITDAYETIMSNSINGYPFVNNVFGTLEPFGYWTGFTMSAMLIILSFALSFMYSIKFDEMVDSFKEGIKAMAKPAFYVVLASIVLVFINNKDSNIFYTISNWINTKISFETIPFSSLTATVYGVFVNDYTSVALQSVGMFGKFFVDGAYSLAIICFQMVYGIVSIITPTSIFLVAGLSYLDIPYKKWLSYIWKLFLCLLVLTLLILLIVEII